jgi:Protein of unknown function DUF262
MLANKIIKPELSEFPEDEFDVEQKSEESASELSPTIPTDNRDRKLVTHPYDFIIRSLKDQVDDHTLVLADDFQRRRVWNDNQSSRLIESLLINVPIPVCYFAELDDGSYSVIDGQQRLTAIYRYLNDEFKLRALKIRSDLNYKKFSQLGVIDQRAINSRTIRCIVILKESHPEIRFDVFDRLNSNSVKLNRQELRNSLYKGKLNQLIKELSESETFKRIRHQQDVDKRMNDCEMILRFFALYFNRDNYRGDLPKFLDDYLQSGQKLDNDSIEKHRLIFTNTIDKVDRVFGDNGFRKYDMANNIWNRSLNRAIYDVIMLYFSQIPVDTIEEKKNDILLCFQQICSNSDFRDTIDITPEKRENFQTRLDLWREALQSIGIQTEKIIVGANHVTR